MERRDRPGRENPGLAASADGVRATGEERQRLRPPVETPPLGIAPLVTVTVVGERLKPLETATGTGDSETPLGTVTGVGDSDTPLGTATLAAGDSPAAVSVLGTLGVSARMSSRWGSASWTTGGVTTSGPMPSPGAGPNAAVPDGALLDEVIVVVALVTVVCANVGLATSAAAAATIHTVVFMARSTCVPSEQRQCH